uniref:PD-(D/E)XK endonuclease-like domain-containing protein n=1 Tax=viral metagenome TaxID=1070528 RepID=A0A6M3LG66_9ZZZZ
MIVTPRDDLAEISLDSLSSSDRSPGLHVSGLIRRLMQRLEPGKYSDDEPDITGVLRMLLGMAFEDKLEWLLDRRWPGRIVRPGEIERDGIVGSPDGVDINEERLYEYKLTWMKYEPDLEHQKYWKYIVQIKAYLAMLGWTRACLWIYFVDGDYRGSGPLLKPFDLEFSQQELAEAWAMLLGAREAADA